MTSLAIKENSISHIKKIEHLEKEIRKFDQLDLPVKNYFSQGVYARELTIPKGCVLTGEIHKYTQLNILSKGDLTVITEEGTRRITAPFTVVSPPGTKRAAYAHEDSVWTTIHGTNETDVDKIRAYFIAENINDYLTFCKTQIIEQITKET